MLKEMVQKGARLAIDSILSYCGLAAEAGLILLLVKVRVFRLLPAFFIYVCWNLFNDAVTVFILQSLPAATYFRIYEFQMVIDSTLMFGVLVELTWSVLRPIRSSLPKFTWIALAVLIAVAGLLVWPLAGLTLPANLAHQGQIFFRLQQTFAILRIVVFLAMAGLSQLLSIGWRNRELQVATGLGFFSIVSLAVSIVHTHQLIGEQYHWLDEVVSAGYLCSLSYWVVAFTTKEAERQNFSPQMENFLLLIGGTAKANRVALRDFPVTKSRQKDHQ
jgi:hypothetical protein